MMTIGQLRQKPTRKRDPSTRKFVVLVDEFGNPRMQFKADEVWRQTKSELGGKFGSDKRRRLVVGFVAPDLLVMYPKGTRQRVVVELKRIYFETLCRIASAKALEKYRAKLDRLRERRIRRRQQAAEKRLFKK